MQNGKNEIFIAFVSAWGELFDFRIPGLSGKKAPAAANRLTAAGFIWCGIIAGGAVALAGTILQLLFNRHIAALSFAVIAFLVLSCKDSCRCDTMVRKRLSAALNSCTLHRTPGNLIIGFLLLFIRFILLLILAGSGAMWYLPLLMAGAFGVQAFLAISMDSPVPLLPDSFHTRHNMVAAAAVTVIAGLCFSPVLTLAAVAAAALVYTTQSSRFRRNGFTTENISIAGYIAEWAMLAAGAAFL